MRNLVYLIGPPGAGKTTTFQTMTEAYRRGPLTIEGCPLEILNADDPSTGLTPPPLRYGLPAVFYELGRTREGLFSGTDALSMSIAPKALKALSHLEGLVIAEGDRLANARWFTEVEDQGWNLTVAYLATPLSEAAYRRATRGTKQNAAWVQGRITKTARLAERFGAIRIAGDGPAAEVAARLAEVIRYTLQETTSQD